jgi:ketosteroid isomerase-like protein
MAPSTASRRKTGCVKRALKSTGRSYSGIEHSGALRDTIARGVAQPPASARFSGGTAKEGTMGEQDNVQVIQDIYAAFGRGDIPAILEALSDDAQIHHAGLPDVIPWGSSTYSGRDGWGKFFGELNATFEPEAFEPQDFIAQGDRVVALGTYRFRARATGRSFDSAWAMAWTFRGGRPVDCRVFEDTDAMASAIRGG